MIQDDPLRNLSPDPGSDILRSISAGLVSMSVGQQRIAAVILENPHWAMQANVEELASKAGTLPGISVGIESCYKRDVEGQTATGFIRPETA